MANPKLRNISTYKIKKNINNNLQISSELSRIISKDKRWKLLSFLIHYRKGNFFLLFLPSNDDNLFIMLHLLVSCQLISQTKQNDTKMSEKCWCERSNMISFQMKITSALSRRRDQVFSLFTSHIILFIFIHPFVRPYLFCTLDQIYLA